MNLGERRALFEQAVRSHESVREGARVAVNFGFSNSARVIEGGLFAGTNNLETYSGKLAAGTGERIKQFVLLCVLTFPPNDEVYFAIIIEKEADKLSDGLLKLFADGEAANAARPPDAKKSRLNNNVKFYLTRSGELYFHNNEFLDSLSEGVVLDPSCKVAVDSILVSIWPPAFSARKSLLARDFVGYLGSLVDPTLIHEVRAWEVGVNLTPSMQRMPKTIDFAELEAAVADLGGHYPGGEVGRLHAALNFLEHKHFVILSGISGTGKTQLALHYARAVHGLGNGVVDPLLFVCPVRPEWTDPSGLTGYYDVLSNRYVVPPFLEAVLEATAHRDSPVFVILDEMNLARMEHYFSDLLSALETGLPLHLHSSGVPLEGSNGTLVRSEIPVPQNLFLVGTINVDESTNPISDKVLDRASVIDMSDVDVGGFLVKLELEPSLEGVCKRVGKLLRSIHQLMHRYGLGFGYRVIEEFVRYHVFVEQHLQTPAETVTDQLLVQKVLIKLRGSERQRALLAELDALVADLPKARALIQRLLLELDEIGSFQAMR